ncbi:MAG: hypothetical protein A2201_08945 [Alicyclobacillus sp. RIFOXYA1_FULL_53_8]|nr:MAG: hypothetical protein A2201_08945 [Alicyclobacillus sp. RIFOXYA1_FULL_53_8]
MQQQDAHVVVTEPVTAGGPGWIRWLGIALLLLVAYIHLALFLRMISFNHVLGVLFLINAVGALIAAVGVLRNMRWVGWALGILMAGGAALVKIAMNTIPGVASLLNGGRRFGGRRGQFGGGNGANFANGGGPGNGPGGGSGSFTGGSPGQFANGGTFHPGGGHGPNGLSNILPMFGNMATFATIAIVIELVFVALAIYALVSQRRNFA